MRRSIPALTAFAAGLITSGAVFLAVAHLQSKIGLPYWHHSLYATLAYGATFTLSLIAGRLLMEATSSGKNALLVAVTALIAGSITSVTSIGFLTGLIFSLAVTAGTLLVRLSLYGRTSLNPRIGAVEALALTALTTACVFAAWTALTAPAYAEGFVVLSMLVVALFNVTLIGSLALSLNLSLERQRPRGAPAVTLLMSALLLGAFSLLYALRIEGPLPSDPPDLTKWQDAFIEFDQPDEATNDSPEDPTFSKEDLVALLSASKKPPPSHSATLYLLTGDRLWAEGFKAGILAAARDRRHTGPEHSVKYGQRPAMIWGMYYIELTAALPELFSADEKHEIETWFSLVIASIFDPGWVDYLYAIPFRSWPAGPYLNQEIGAGAVAVFRRFADPEDRELQRKIDGFLSTQAQGWRTSFKNLDDSYEYQDVWMGSAFALNRYADESAESLRPGLEAANAWIKHQAPRQPFPLNYGLPGDAFPIDSLAMGAFVLRDPESRWLLSRQLGLLAQKGAKLPKELTAVWLWDDEVPESPPALTSGYLQSPSGYSFRPGKLMPDKLVLRGPAGPKDPVLQALVNLRADGWHRYPSTNTLTSLLWGDNPILVEGLSRMSHNWLPAGRSQHRDKKVDRSRLNGLVVERTGLDAWIGAMTGVYSQWRQDVKRFAKPSMLAATGETTVAQVSVRDWNGLSHKRTYVIADANTFIVADQVADSRPNRLKALHWYLGRKAVTGPTDDTDVSPTSLDVRAAGSSGVSIQKGSIDTDFIVGHPVAPPKSTIVMVSSEKEFCGAILVGNGIDDLSIGSVPYVKEGGCDGSLLLRAEGQSNPFRLIISDNMPWEIDGVNSDASAAIIFRDGNTLRFAIFEASSFSVPEGSGAKWEPNHGETATLSPGEQVETDNSEATLTGTLTLYSLP